MTNNELINELAAAALTNFEFSCEWGKAAQAAKEECQDLGFKPRKSLILHAVNLAKIQWNEQVIQTKQAIS